MNQFLNSFGRPPPLKTRVYLYRGLNLAAQEDNTQIGNKLAGMMALCSADTFPVLKVGNGGTLLGVTKVVNDKSNVVPKSLNPEYFRPFELDACFPNDWKLEIAIMNQTAIWKYNLIGNSLIDLEDRFYGDTRNKQRLAYEIYLQYYDDELNQPKSSGDITKIERGISYQEKRAFYKEKKVALAAKIEGIENKMQSFVEYRHLKYPGKAINQGSLEMSLEILPINIGNLF